MSRVIEIIFITDDSGIAVDALALCVTNLSAAPITMTQLSYKCRPRHQEDQYRSILYCFRDLISQVIKTLLNMKYIMK